MELLERREGPRDAVGIPVVGLAASTLCEVRDDLPPHRVRHGDRLVYPLDGPCRVLLQSGARDPV